MNNPIIIDIYKLLDKNSYINEKCNIKESIHSFSYLSSGKERRFKTGIRPI